MGLNFRGLIRAAFEPRDQAYSAIICHTIDKIKFQGDWKTIAEGTSFGYTISGSIAAMGKPLVPLQDIVINCTTGKTLLASSVNASLNGVANLIACHPSPARNRQQKPGSRGVRRPRRYPRSRSLSVRNWPQAARISRPRGSRTGEAYPAADTMAAKRLIASGVLVS